jgi:hypothetical protein
MYTLLRGWVNGALSELADGRKKEAGRSGCRIAP